ncbi:MAG: ABC transporter substrate-binding protein [Chloroflexota bacterium]
MSTTIRARAAKTLAAAAVGVSVLVPAAAPVAAADPVVLRVGTTQDIDTTNPFGTALVSGYEAYQLTYNLLVDFGTNLEPVPGFADKWERAADGKSWTFHIRDGMKWSDGQPATSADACYSWGLVLAAKKDDSYVGSGYLDAALTTDAGVTKVECPDDSTMIATTSDASDRVLQTYIPIIPKHIYGKYDYKQIGDTKFTGFNAPLVGTGPYTLTEWKTSQYVKFQRNPNYWGTQGYPDQVIIQFFKSDDTMVQALKAGELDYARDPNSQQLKTFENQPGYKTVVGAANGWTQLAFNTYGEYNGKTIPNGGPSTKAMLDPAFRDALGYAVDKQTLVQKVLGGYGDVGDTIIPPVLGQWHVTPDKPRTFSIDTAKQKLDAAGYTLDGSGNRLDKEGKPINLLMVLPDSNSNYAKAAQFIQTWYGQLGIKVTTRVLDQATLSDLILPPEAGKGKTAKYDIELWGWSGSPDPNALLQIFRCDAIGNTSDSQYCNPEYDKLYDQETAAQTADARKAILAQMQNMIYDQAVYDILYYDANLAVYHTDKFGGWENIPENGTPLFTYSTLSYTKLVSAAAAASPTPAPSSAAPSAGASAGASAAPSAAPSSAATPAPSADTGNASASGGAPVALLGLIAVVVVVVVVLLLVRRRGPSVEDE